MSSYKACFEVQKSSTPPPSKLGPMPEKTAMSSYQACFEVQKSSTPSPKIGPHARKNWSAPLQNLAILSHYKLSKIDQKLNIRSLSTMSSYQACFEVQKSSTPLPQNWPPRQEKLVRPLPKSCHILTL